MSREIMMRSQSRTLGPNRLVAGVVGLALSSLLVITAPAPADAMHTGRSAVAR